MLREGSARCLEAAARTRAGLVMLALALALLVSLRSASAEQLPAAPTAAELSLAGDRCEDRPYAQLGLAPLPGVASEIDVEFAIAHVSALSCWTRSGTGAKMAEEFLERKLRQLGVDFDKELVRARDPAELRRRTFGGLGLMGSFKRTVGLEKPARNELPAAVNFVLRFGPPGPALLLMAHYDSTPESPGVLEGATGVAVLLEVARVLKDHPPSQPVMIALMSREPVLGHGQKLGTGGDKHKASPRRPRERATSAGAERALALARSHASEVRLAISVQMIGTEGPLSVKGAGELVRKAELQWLSAAADKVGVSVDVPISSRRGLPGANIAQLAAPDCRPFSDRGIPTFTLYHRGANGELIDTAELTKYDVLAKDRPRSAKLTEVGRLVLALVASPVPQEDLGDGFWVPGSGGRVVARTYIILGDALLAAVAALFGLVLLRRRHEPKSKGVGLLGVGGLLLVTCGWMIGLERFLAEGHPAPWVHDARRAIGGLLVLGAGLVTFLVALSQRLLGIAGERRFLAAAISLLLVMGGAVAAVDAWELAWLWLLPAALLAVAPHCGKWGWLLLVAAVLPTLLLVDPHHLRELAFYEVYRVEDVRIGAWIAVNFAPHALAAVWWTARRPRGSPGRQLAVLGISLALVSAGTALYSTITNGCEESLFLRYGLSCEQYKP